MRFCLGEPFCPGRQSRSNARHCICSATNVLRLCREIWHTWWDLSTGDLRRHASAIIYVTVWAISGLRPSQTTVVHCPALLATIERSGVLIQTRIPSSVSSLRLLVKTIHQVIIKKFLTWQFGWYSYSCVNLVYWALIATVLHAKCAWSLCVYKNRTTDQFNRSIESKTQDDYHLIKVKLTLQPIRLIAWPRNL